MHHVILPVCGAILLLALTACTPGEQSTADAPTAAPPPPSVAAKTSGDEESCRSKPPPQPVACTMEWRPVCGCDGKTYSNACMARAAGIKRHTPGECGGDESS